MTTPLAAKIAREYGTPVAVIDMDRVERNSARIQAACDAAGVANRAHIKTHKSPMLAKLQIAAGAKGITCQKLGEAEVMAEAGIDDILISYNLIGEEKMARLGALQTKANMTVAADNAVVIAGLPQACDHHRIVGGDGHVGFCLQRAEPCHLLLADQVITDQDVVDPGLRH